MLEGLAPDGGLYVPETYPTLDLAGLRSLSYPQLAYQVLRLFADDIPEADLQRIVDATYTKEVFGTPDITPLVWLEPGLGLLKLSEGPTLAFKDVPLQLLGNLMEYVLEQQGSHLNILGATSGDTGSAAAYALRGKQRLRLFMLSPKGRMSAFQQGQMYTLNEPNIFNLVVSGTFDDCQATVKLVNSDKEFKDKYKIGAVNSINWARIASQVVYYVWAYLRATSAPGEKVAFAVPSGNFGNALSAYIAQRMGLPIRIVVSTNENDVLDQFFKSGVYQVRQGNDVLVTSSPSMDIASASNFERWVYDHVGRDAAKVRALFEQVKAQGKFALSEHSPGMRHNITSGSATQTEVLKTIKAIHQKYGVVIDPHTAVAVAVGLRQKGSDTLVVAETAQPAKFADTIQEALGFKAPVPKEYEHLASLPQHVTHIEPDAQAVKDFIASHV